MPRHVQIGAMTRRSLSPTFSAIASAGALAIILSQDSPAAPAPQDTPDRGPAYSSCGALVDATGAKVSPRAGGAQIGTATSRPCAARGSAVPVAPTPSKPELVVPLPPTPGEPELAVPVAPTASKLEAAIPLPPTPRKPEAVRPSGAVPGLSADAAPRSPSAHPGPLEFAADHPERVGVALLTGGAMLWMLKSGLLTSLLMLGVPVWRHVDLLPIVAAAQPDGRDARHPQTGSEDAAVAQVLDTAKAGPRRAAPS
jgi:hypothetical protein